MGKPSGCYAGLVMCLVAGLPPAIAAAPKFEAVILRGKVMPLNAALQAVGLDLKPDQDPTNRQMVLLGDDRAITPLLCDDASRAFFLDERLRGIRTEIRGRRYVSVPYIQVSSFQVEREGRLQTPEYFCSVCTINVRYPQTCPCCQGPMELRMKPERP